MSRPFHGVYICATLLVGAFSISASGHPQRGSDGAERRSLSSQSGAGATESERVQIIQEVLRLEAINHRDEAVCAATASNGRPFDRQRETERGLEEELVRRPDPALQRLLNEMRQGPLLFEWRQSPGWSGREPGPRLDAETSRLLSAAAERSLRSPPEMASPVAIDPQSRPSALRSDARNCHSLRFTAPVILDDIAFVETSYVCGGLCGNGLLHALRRSNGRWAVVGVTLTWVS